MDDAGQGAKEGGKEWCLRFFSIWNSVSKGVIIVLGIFDDIEEAYFIDFKGGCRLCSLAEFSVVLCHEPGFW